MLIRAHGDRTPSEATVLLARPGPLVATKLQALPNRTTAKEATDLADIVRLTLDPWTGVEVRDQLTQADRQLKADAALHVHWFIETAVRSARLARFTPAGQEVDVDTLNLGGELLLTALR